MTGHSDASPRTLRRICPCQPQVGPQGPRYISPTVQKEAIARWAEYRGVQIAAWHIDEDESGGT